MTQTQWIRMNHEQADRVLGQLSHSRDAVVFSPGVTEVSWRGLAFYNSYRLCRLTNYATMPVFTMVYLTDGNDYIPLDGTANPIYTADEKDPVLLNASTVIPYLEFFFSNVQGAEGNVFLIRDPKKLPLVSTISPAQRQLIADHFKPPMVSFDPEENVYKITGTLHYGGELLAATVIVTADGKMSFQEQNLLMSGLNFPTSLYTSTWAEGQSA